MRRSARSTLILGAATAVALATAGLFSGGAAVADDSPTPTDPPTATAPPDVDDSPIDPGWTPVPYDRTKPTGGHSDGFEIDPRVDGLTPTANGNNFSSAVALTYPNTLWPFMEFDSSAATIQTGEPRALNAGYYLYRTMWAKWKAPFSGYVTVSVYGASGEDTGVNVYTGTKFSNLKRIAWNDQQFSPIDGSNLSGPSEYGDNAAKILSLKVAAGTYYYFQIGRSQHGATGPALAGFTDITLSIQANRYFAANDYISQATELKFATGSGGKASTRAMLNGATIESWEPTDNKDESSPGANDRTGSVWYKWAAPQTGVATFSACETLAVPSVAVYTNAIDAEGSGVGYGDLKSVAWDYNGATSTQCPEALTGGSYTAFVARKGQVYYLQVAHTEGILPANAGLVQLGEIFTKPYIDKLSKTSGKPNDIVVITGFSFGATPVVKFGTKTATILGAPTATSITVKVPSQGGKKGKVYVTVTSSANVSNLGVFTYK